VIKYKIWMFIEELADDDDGRYEEIDGTMCSIGQEFKTLDEAKEFQEKLTELIF